MSQVTDTIMMIRPASFGFNEQTAKNNVFQSEDSTLSQEQVSAKAIEEFDKMVEILRSKGIKVIVIQDTEEPKKPDAIFPNNWISFHANGSVITYPMYAPNRRIERREDIIEQLGKEFDIEKRYSFEHYESEDMFLEGTGSMLLDRENKIVYACLSERTDIRLVDKFCVLTGYSKVTFNAVDRNQKPIYHTNVMMALAEDFCVVVLDSITDEAERSKLLISLERTGKEIIDISHYQMEAYAGNMLQVKNENGNTFMVLSKSAYDSLNAGQVKRLETMTDLLPIDIETIETIGGGSVRCMMAEVFLPYQHN